jgi:serine/threonine protein kinase
MALFMGLPFVAIIPLSLLALTVTVSIFSFIFYLVKSYRDNHLSSSSSSSSSSLSSSSPSTSSASSSSADPSPSTSPSPSSDGDGKGGEGGAQEGEQQTAPKRYHSEIPKKAIKKIRKIGSGAYGVVYECEVFGSRVAVKEASNGLMLSDVKHIQALHNEIKILASSPHMHVVQLIGACCENHYVAIVMELMDGNLFDLLITNKDIVSKGKKSQPPPLDIDLYDRVDMARQTALGLNRLHCHEPTIIHRDLKLENILYKKQGDKYVVKVADFGLGALRPLHRPSITDENNGTPLTRAPEVLRGEPYNERADVYSFGLCLWSIASRSILFPIHQKNRSTFSKFRQAILEGERPPLPTIDLLLRRGPDNIGSSSSEDTIPFKEKEGGKENENENAKEEGRGRPRRDSPRETERVHNPALERLRKNGRGLSREDARDVLRGVRVARSCSIPPRIDLTPSIAWPPSLSRLMIDCWDKDPHVRPSFDDIIRRLDDALIDIAISDEVGRTFWRQNFGNVDTVEWNTFQEALLKFSNIQHSAPAMRQPLDILAKLLGRDTVNIKKFGDLLEWFGGLAANSHQELFLQRVLYLCNESWFHGPVSGEEAETRLLSQPKGTFLVRFSTKRPAGNFALSVNLNGTAPVSHYRIVRKENYDQSDGKYSYLFENGRTCFPSVVDLIESILADWQAEGRTLQPCPGSPYAKLSSEQQTYETLW